MSEDSATIVVVPRDHFSDTRESLESLLEFTPPPRALVYVDGGSPPRIARYLRERATAANFELIRRDHYLTPNQARTSAPRARRRDTLHSSTMTSCSLRIGSRHSSNAPM